jgi:D-galactonate transporter
MNSVPSPKTAGPSPEVGPHVIGKLFRHLIPFLFLVYIVNYLDRINVGFAALQMQIQLGLSDRVYGLGAGIFFAGYLLFQLPSNLAMHRVGSRRWMSAIMVAWGLISSCMIFVHTARGFYELRFLLGVAEAGFFPGIILYLKQWFPAGARARAMALFMTANPLAGVIGGPISGALLGLNAGPLAGWQWLFLIEGTPAVILGLLTLWLLAEHPEDVSWLSAEERSWLTSELHREGEMHPDAARNWSAAFSNIKVWLLTAVYFGLTTCMYGLVYFLPKIIRNVSTSSNFGLGLLSAIPYIVTAIAMVLTGMHSDRTGERRRHLAILALLSAVGAYAAGYSTSTVATVALLSLAMSGETSMLGPFWALAASALSESTAPAGIALINSIGNLGGLLGPYSIGLLRNTHGFRGGMIVIGTAVALAGLIALTVRDRGEFSHRFQRAEFSDTT